MMTRRTVALCMLIIGLVTLTAVASAKSVPYVEPLDEDWGGVEEPFVASSGAYFANFFGRLNADDVDAISLTFDAPVENMRVDLLVPECGDLLSEFYPSLAVVGPGLDAPDSDLLAELPFELDDADELGVALLVAGGPAEDADETRLADVNFYEWMYYGENLAVQADIPQAGDYIFVVWDPDGSAGAYALNTGAVHPDGQQFPDAKTLDTLFRQIETGSWIGLDCEAERAASPRSG
jgi:hypothetical protein